MFYRHLLGRPYDPYAAHCYTLVRDVYRQNFDIELLPIAHPAGFWRRGHDIITNGATTQGFVPVPTNPREMQTGDLILIAKDSSVANHLGIYLDSGEMLHHLTGSVSSADPYLRGGYWRSLTVGVFRHPKVQINPIVTPTVDLWSVLPENVRARLVEAGVDPGDPEQARG